MKKSELKKWLNEKADYYNRPFFIESDPISVPHLFSKNKTLKLPVFLQPSFPGAVEQPSLIKQRS